MTPEGWRRPADRISVFDRQHAGLSQFKGLRGIRRAGSAFRLECVARVLNLAGRAFTGRATAADNHEVASTFKRILPFGNRLVLKFTINASINLTNCDLVDTTIKVGRIRCLGSLKL